MLVEWLGEALMEIAWHDTTEFFKLANLIVTTREQLLDGSGGKPSKKDRAKIIPLVVNVDDTERN